MSKTKPNLQGSDHINARRKFMSTGLFGGMTLALTPGWQSFIAGAEDTAPSTLPTPADSLSLYVMYLDRIRGELLNPYFELVACLSSEVKSRYEQLREDVAELERLVPQLSASVHGSSLRSATDVGEASASMIKNLADEQVVSIEGVMTLVSFTSESFKNTIIDLENQQGSLKLSRKAAELLRKIIREIYDLQKPTEGLEKTSKILTELNADLDGMNGKNGKIGKMTAIRSKLLSAITELVIDDLAGARQREGNAKELINGAIKDLQQLDGYSPPESLKAYIEKSRSARCSTDRTYKVATSQPTQNLRDLLAGTVKWIETKGQLSRDTERTTDGVVYVKASTKESAAPNWIGKWYEVRQILNEELPPGSRLRTGVCVGLIGPILIAFNNPRRFDLIYDQILNLWPSGSLDRNDAKRRSAAKRLADL